MHNGRIVVARLWPEYDGGVPSRTPIILRLHERKYETICIYLAKNSTDRNVFAENNLKVFYIRQKPPLKIFAPITLLRLVKILRQNKVDILHCHKHKATVYGALAARLAGVPVTISHVHGMGRSRNRRRRFINRIIFRWTNAILAVSKSVRQDILAKNPALNADKVITLGNSIEPARFGKPALTGSEAKARLNLPADCFAFGTIGRLVPTKGQIHLVRAFASVRHTLPAAHLIIVGQGQLRRTLEDQARDLDCFEFVHFYGHRNDIVEVLRAMDVFVLPSIAEGLPRSLMEAMASGVLCLGSDIPGISEILDKGRCGLLVEPQNDEAFSKAMLKAAAMAEQEKTAMIENAKRRIRQQYCHEVIIKRLDRIYTEQFEKSSCRHRKKSY